MQRTYILHLSKLDDGDPWQRSFGALPIRLGRNALNDCVISQNYVSDFHARIEEIDGRICIRDLGSKNGVFLVHAVGARPERVSPQTAVHVPFLGNGHVFFIGPMLKARVEVIESVAPSSIRAASFGGSVIGNQSLLSGAPPPGPAQAWAGLPSLAPVGALPSLDGAASANPGWHQAGPPHVPGPPSPVPAPHKNTGHFSLSPEMLALVGLRELGGSLVPGQPLETTGDIARLITKLHDAIEMFCRCFIPLREGYAQFVSSMDLQRAALQRSRNRSQGCTRVEQSQSPAEVAIALLDWRDSSLDAPTAIEGIFADLMVHQVALLDGVMRGVRSLLAQLDPENIEKETTGERNLGLNLGRHKALWEAYRRRFDELSEEHQAFSLIFGAEFTEAYRERKARPPQTPSSRPRRP